MSVRLAPSLHFAPVSELSPVPPPPPAYGARSRRVESTAAAVGTFIPSTYLARPLNPLRRVEPRSFRKLVSIDPFAGRPLTWEDDGSGAAAISDGHRQRG